MSNNCFSTWKCLCAKEALVREQHASTKRAIIEDACVADKPLAELGDAVTFLTDEQAMLYLVTGKIG